METAKMGDARRTRSDKKTHIAPYVTEAERELIQKLTRQIRVRDPFICEGEVGRRLVEAAVHNEMAINYFRPYLHRPFDFTETHTIWREKNPLQIIQYILSDEPRQRFKIKVEQPLQNRLDDFKIALGTSYLSHATYALLRYALEHDDLLRQLVPQFIRVNVERKRPDANAWNVLGD